MVVAGAVVVVMVVLAKTRSDFPSTFGSAHVVASRAGVGLGGLGLWNE